MELNVLFQKLKMDYLSDNLQSLCEQAAKADLGYREFLTEALASRVGGPSPEGARGPPEPGSTALDQDPGAVRLQLSTKH
jgi:hypothetical protein